MIARAMNITGLKVEFNARDADKLLAGFSDADKAADYAQNSIAAFVKLELFSAEAVIWLLRRIISPGRRLR